MENQGNGAELQVSAESVLRFQINRSVTTVFKHSLDVIDELKSEHFNALQKLKSAIPKEYHGFIELANPFDSNKLATVRKRVLTVGNDCIRHLDEQVTNYKEFRN